MVHLVTTCHRFAHTQTCRQSEVSSLAELHVAGQWRGTQTENMQNSMQLFAHSGASDVLCQIFINNLFSPAPMAELVLRQLLVVNWPVLCVCHMWVFVSHVAEMRLWASDRAEGTGRINVKQ